MADAVTVGGLFDGAGLLALGLHQAGLEHRWLCESDPWRRGILERRFPGVPVHADVRRITVKLTDEHHRAVPLNDAPDAPEGGDAQGSLFAEVEPVDVVAGGFPRRPAKASQAPVSARGSGIPRPFCGERCGGPLASYDRASSSWRTSKLSLLSTEGTCGERWSGTWPRSGTTRHGIAFPLVPSAPRTSATASSPLLSTPTAWLGRRPNHAEGDPERWHNPDRSNELSDQVAAIHEKAVRLLPTPNASLSNYEEEPSTWETRNREVRQRLGYRDAGGRPLPIALKMLPTPTEQDGSRNSTAPPSQFERNSLALPALAVSLSSGASTSPPSDGGKPSLGLRLNPSFVEWMMGLPTCAECGRGWTDTDCPHAVTEFKSKSDGSSAST
jgi:hypothetical protein